MAEPQKQSRVWERLVRVVGTEEKAVEVWRLLYQPRTGKPALTEAQRLLLHHFREHKPIKSLRQLAIDTGHVHPQSTANSIAKLILEGHLQVITEDPPMDS